MGKNLKTFSHRCTGNCQMCKYRSKIFENQVHRITKQQIRHNKRKSLSLKASKRKIEHEGIFAFFLTALSNSSVTGINSLASARHPIRRTMWCFVFQLCLMGFLYQLFSFVVIYNGSPTEVVLRVENQRTLAFPAVTICNNNRIRKSEYCKIYKDKCSANESYLKLSEKKFLQVHAQVLEDNRFDLRFRLGHSESIIRACIFKGTQYLRGKECLKRFVFSFDPDFGNCFTFSSRRKDGSLLFASETDFWQNENVLTLVLDAQREEFTESRRVPGLVLALHSESSLPDIYTDGEQVETGSSSSLAMKQSKTKLLPSPYRTNCTNYITLPWVSEDTYPSPRMCTVLCSQHFQLTRCGYVTTRLNMFFMVLPWDPEEVTPGKVRCAIQMERVTKKYCKSICELPCVNDLALVRIYYKTIERKIFEHVPKYTRLELFSHLGGCSGIWLGFSLLSMYELIEICISTLQFAFTRRNKKLLPDIKKSNFHAKRLKRVSENVIRKLIFHTKRTIPFA